MCELIEVIKRNFLGLKQIAHDIAFMDEVSDYDKYRLNNALKGCTLLLIVLKDGAPNLYAELKKEFDASVTEIKDKFEPDEYGFIGSLYFPE